MARETIGDGSATTPRRVECGASSGEPVNTTLPSGRSGGGAGGASNASRGSRNQIRSHQVRSRARRAPRARAADRGSGERVTRAKFDLRSFGHERLHHCFACRVELHADNRPAPRAASKLHAAVHRRGGDLKLRRAASPARAPRQPKRPPMAIDFGKVVDAPSIVADARRRRHHCSGTRGPPLLAFRCWRVGLGPRRSNRMPGLSCIVAHRLVHHRRSVRATTHRSRWTQDTVSPETRRPSSRSNSKSTNWPTVLKQPEYLRQGPDQVPPRSYCEELGRYNQAARRPAGPQQQLRAGWCAAG